MLLAQIKSGYSSTDPSSTDPSSTDPSSADEASELERETEQKQEAEEQEGEDDDKETSDSDADICASKASGRHRLLRAKLCLTVGTTPGRRAAGQGTTPGQTEGNSSEGEAESRSSSEPWAVSESLSESEGEESQSKRTRSRNNAWEDDQRSYLQKKRRRLLQLQDCTGGDQSSSGVGEDEGEDSIASPKGRKKIRRIMGNDHLRFETQNALKEEEDRRKRLAEREQEQRERLREVTVIGNTPEDPCQVTPKLVLDEDPGSKEPLVQVHTHLVTKLKPHQVDGVQFIWDCCCETTEKAQKSTGSGCILAHCMGLGKTLQVVTFLHTVLRCENLNFKTALVVCPLNTVLNWLYEFDKWQEGMLDGESVQVSELVTVRRPQERSEALQRWQKAGGVMIISYETYRNLTQGKKTSGQSLRTVFLSTLVNPGPDFVICDEGHVLKNQCTAISRAMSSVRTRRRVVLTGTPLQNNLAEYHCMVNFIKENLLGSIKEFRNRFINPILNGQCADSTPSDVRLMKKRAHILYEMLAGCVQRRDYTTLTRILPPKHEYVLAIRVSPLQYKLYIYYLDHFSSVKGGRVQPGNRLFKDFQVLSRILAHPWCVELAYISKENKGHFDGSSSEKSRTWETSESSPSLGSDEDEKVKRVKRRSERVTGQWDSGAVEVPEESSGHSRGGNPVGSCDVRRVGEAKAFSRLRPGCSSPGWHKEFVTEADSKVLEHSGKMVLLFEILRMAEEVGDKVLVFSQSLISLDIIEDFLELAGKEEEHLRYKGKGAWSRNRDYYRLDGSTGAATRKRWADDFNDSSNKRGRLFLISTRAGSLGINLVAANRVIIFDASWNPSHDIQSIFRVYRFGQLKPVFVYRFLAQGTMEEKIYGRQVAKQSLSFRVVDKQQIQRHFTMNELAELYHFRPDRLDQPKSVGRRMQRTWILPKDPFLAELLHSFKEQIVGYHEHDSLLDHKEEEALSVEERTAAWAEYEAEKKGLSLTMNLLTYSNMIYEGSKQHYMVNIAALKTMTATQLQELINQGREKVKQASDALELLSNQRVGASLADSLWNVKPQQGQSLAVAQESSMKAELKRREAVYRSTLQKQQVLEMCIQKMELDRKMQPTVMKEGTTAN